MTRRALLVAALAALAAGCGDDSAPTVTIGFRQPAALAVFRGVTLDDTANVRPYVAVANAARNDLTLLDATDDTPVAAPVQLKALVLPVAERPILLAAASLGDGADKADLLVAVSAGDPTVQLVRTWTPSSGVVPEASVDLAAALGLAAADVVALTPVPSAPGTARIALALADRRIAVVQYARAADGVAIEAGAAIVSAQLAFQPIALAAAPDDPLQADVQTAIYAATLDPIQPGLFGVAAISPDLSAVAALGARGPTRLVAAARLRERGPLSTAKDGSAFDLAAGPVLRVYAVLDESGCGLDRPIDCGVVTLAPELAGAEAIPEDWAGRMPYRAPIPIPGRPLALAVAPPPAVPPAAELTQYAGAAMRAFGGASETTTTGVGVVASDDGKAYFLDLGRFKALTAGTTLGTLAALVVTPGAIDTASDATELRRRLWIQDPGTGAFVPDLATGNPDLAAAAGLVKRTPGWTRTSSWTISYQTELPGLAGRSAEAGADAGGPWLAMQVGYGTAPRRLTQVVKLWHPALGVRAGDVAVIKAAGVPGCVGTPPPGTPAGTAEADVRREFELPIASLLPPTADHPGGAVSLSAPAAASPETLAAWTACYEGLRSAGGILPRLSATLRAGGFLVTSTALGYAGRPQEDAPGSWSYALAYPAPGEDEDTLAAACPLVDWDGVAPTIATCDAVCRATCERAVLARKARRVHHNFESCETPDGPAECAALFGGVTLPGGDVVDELGVTRPGPVVSFRFGVQEVDAGAGVDPVRGLTLVLSTAGGETPLFPALTTGSPYLASSAVAFDRSTVVGAAGYRFLVSYTSDMVLDTTPQLNPPEAVVIR